MASNLLSNFHDTNFSSPSSPSSSTRKTSSSSLSHGRAIDRYSPHLRDPLREKYSSRFHSKANPSNQKNRKNTEKTPQITSPATSSRYLLNDVSVAIDDFSDAEIFPPVISVDELRFEYLTKGEDFILMESPSSSPVRQIDQVVVMKVSLHCKGCERKVRKHISKMKGVKSFTTDLASKKVTVIGDLTPLSVLDSISTISQKLRHDFRRVLVCSGEDDVKVFPSKFLNNFKQRQEPHRRCLLRRAPSSMNSYAGDVE